MKDLKIPEYIANIFEEDEVASIILSFVEQRKDADSKSILQVLDALAQMRFDAAIVDCVIRGELSVDWDDKGEELLFLKGEKH